MEILTPKRLFNENRIRLRLSRISGEHLSAPAIEPHELRVVLWQPDGVPNTNYLRIVEAAIWRQRGDMDPAAWCNELLAGDPFAVVFGDGVIPDAEFIRCFEVAGIPLFSSSLPSERVYNELIYYQRALLGESVVLHGVFLEVHGVGLVLSGEAGVGKSELALALVSRGHRFVADDSPEFWRDGDALSGACPAVLQDFIEVRGLGFLDIRTLFGDSSIKLRKNLQLIIQLKRMPPEELILVDRALDSVSMRDILGIRIPVITLPVTAGQQLAVLVETAVKVHIQRRQGYDSNRVFAQRQSSMMND